MTDAITIQNPRNRGGSTGHVLAKRSVTFTEIRNEPECLPLFFPISVHASAFCAEDDSCALI
ncbi:hypothetical protein EQ831_00925 [Pseudomonas sp. ALS1279]|nr:hypothetical protein EQ831_00925 [Pseudomonas sp. ALS1279]